MSATRCPFRKSCASDVPCKYSDLGNRIPRQTGGGIAVRSTSFTRLCGLLWVCTLLSACVMSSPSPRQPAPSAPLLHGAQLHGSLVDMSTQRLLSVEAFVDEITGVNLIALGEEHYHPDIQRFTLQLLQALARRYPQHLALAMEFLERDMQPYVDAYLAGTSDAATFQQDIRATPDFTQHYFPLLQYARQANIPVLAMNLPRRLARQVAQQGLQHVLPGLAAQEQAYVPGTLAAITPQYRTYFQQAIASAHPLPAEQSERFLEAAHLKDETMADTLSTFFGRVTQDTVLAIAGRFHFDYGLAIPARLQQRFPTVAIRRVTTMSVAADERIDLQELARTGLADYVWFAPPRPTAQTGT